MEKFAHLQNLTVPFLQPSAHFRRKSRYESIWYWFVPAVM